MLKKRPLFIGIGVMAVLGALTGPLGKNLLGLPDWLIVPQPHPELPAEPVFQVFRFPINNSIMAFISRLPGFHPEDDSFGFPITNSIIATWVTLVFLGSFCYIVTRKLTLVPGRRQAILEFIVAGLLKFCQSIAGEKNGRRFFPLIATIFLFVAFNAWLSLVPGYGSILFETGEHHKVHLLRGANTDINTPLAVAAISFVAIEFVGLSTLGVSYLGKFVNLRGLGNGVVLLFKGQLKTAFSALFSGVIDAGVGALEALSEFIRVLSFTLRLFGNMTAGEILLLVIVFLVPWALAVLFYGLELLVGLIQAFIFASLTLVFMTVAAASHGHGGETAHH